MKTRVYAGVVYAFCACVAGCAAPGATSVATTTSAPIRATISERDAKHAIAIGKSTRADVIAALGKTQVVSFDSGFEVWVYHYKDDTPAKAGKDDTPAKAGKDDTPAKAGSAKRIERTAFANWTPGKAEFVVLFAPSGVVAKTRIRPAPAPGEAKGK